MKLSEKITKFVFVLLVMVFAFIFIGLGIWSRLPKQSATTSTFTSSTTSNNTSNASTPSGTNSSATSTSTTSGYTTSQVASHNTGSSCWLVVDSKVYDVTAYLSQRHPGGNVITAYCGHDASSVFTLHNSSGYNTLANYYIANLI